MMHPRVEAALSQLPLDQYRVHRHAELPAPIKSPADFAAALGYERGRILKAVFLKGGGAGGEPRFALAVCGADRKLDLARLARTLGSEGLKVASPEELAAVLDYPSRGVSPLGVPPSVPVVVDSAVTAFPTVLVGAGAVGVEVEVAPHELVRLANAMVEAATA